MIELPSSLASDLVDGPRHRLPVPLRHSLDRIENEAEPGVPASRGFPSDRYFIRGQPSGTPKEVPLGYILRYFEDLRQGFKDETRPPPEDLPASGGSDKIPFLIEF